MTEQPTWSTAAHVVRTNAAGYCRSGWAGRLVDADGPRWQCGHLHATFLLAKQCADLTKGKGDGALDAEQIDAGSLVRAVISASRGQR